MLFTLKPKGGFTPAAQFSDGLPYAIASVDAEKLRMTIKYDPTINLGHILTFASMVAAVMASYSLLDKRVGVLEERSNAAITQAADKAVEQRESLREIKADIKDLQRSVNEISRAVAGGKK